MENKVIEVLEYLGDKLGIAIDWTSENVVPQVMEVLERYRTFSIWDSSIRLGIWLFVLVIVCVSVAKIIELYASCCATKEDNLLWETYGCGAEFSAFGFVVMLITAGAFFGSAIAIGIGINNVLRWIFIPEFQYLELLNSMIGA